MAGTGTLVDLLLFYTLERTIFNRMVCKMGKNSQQIKKTIALWLLLEEIGYHDLIRNIHSYDGKTIDPIFNQTLKCLECIKLNSSSSSSSSVSVESTIVDDNTPIFINLFDHKPLYYRFIYYNQELISERHAYIMETVCNKIFGDTVAIDIDESRMRPVVPPRKSSLNPEAPEFYPRQINVESSRSMSLTFSKCYLLTREEIVNFFTSNWGEVVEDAFMQQCSPGQDPQVARIVLSSSSVIPSVLNGQYTAKFLVNCKHVWDRVYEDHHGGRRKS